MHEVDVKVERLARLARAEGVGGILINTQPNFAWLTGGRSNRIDSSRERGAGNLLVTDRGERYAIANNIEMPRLNDEVLPGLGFSPCEHAWTREQAEPDSPIVSARRLTNGGEIACDAALPGGRPIESQIAAARALLTDEEVARYRALGGEVGRAVGEACRAMTPGLDETSIANRIAAAVRSSGARPIVTMVAADERIDRYRHPVPTQVRWRERLLIALCAERDGLIVSLSRLLCTGTVPDDLAQRTAAAAHVFEALLRSTRPGTTGAELFCAAARAYEAQGFAGEETRHHQGGATGYRSRDWLAHPTSREMVQRQQAFAWNPSITGTKVEETALLVDGHIEIITTSPRWPPGVLPV